MLAQAVLLDKERYELRAAAVLERNLSLGLLSEERSKSSGIESRFHAFAGADIPVTRLSHDARLPGASRSSLDQVQIIHVMTTYA
jgi:hypothetical protein